MLLKTRDTIRKFPPHNILEKILSPETWLFENVFMEFKFYVNPDTSKLHILDHDVEPEEIFDFFSQPLILERRRLDGSFEAFGRIPSGRFLTVAYRKESPETLFVITAFDLQDRQIIDKLVRELE